MKIGYILKSILILLIFLFASSCNNQDDVNDNELPLTFYIYFEIKKNDGSFFEDGEVELTHEMKMENGQIITFGGPIVWYEMGKNNTGSAAMNTTLYGIGPCDESECVEKYFSFPFSMTSGAQTNETDNYLFNRYFLIRYNETEMDTLRIRDEKIGGIVNFKFYVNEQLKEVLGNPGLGFSQESPNYIQIQK